LLAPLREICEKLGMQKPFLSETQWQKIEPLLPREKSAGRFWADNRRVLAGILWVLKTGARWRDLPKGYPSPATCWRRLGRWGKQGVWLNIWRAFLSELDARGTLDWEESFLDASFAPAKKGARAAAKPNAARAQSGWWWSTARVFLWEANWPRPAQRKLRSPKAR
jgi:transposase